MDQNQLLGAFYEYMTLERGNILIVCYHCRMNTLSRKNALGNVPEMCPRMLRPAHTTTQQHRLLAQTGRELNDALEAGAT